MDPWPGFLLLFQATQIQVLRELRSPCSLSHVTAAMVSVSFCQEGAPFEGLAPSRRRGVGSRQACCPRAEQGHGWPDRPARHPNHTADARQHLVPSLGVAVVQPPAQACPPSKKGSLRKRLYQTISAPFTTSFHRWRGPQAVPTCPDPRAWGKALQRVGRSGRGAQAGPAGCRLWLGQHPSCGH